MKTSAPKKPPLPKTQWCQGCWIYEDRGVMGGIWDYARCYSICWHRKISKGDKLTDERI